MAQVEVTPVIKIKPENVDTYVKAICAMTGATEPPVGEVTSPQMNALIRALMNWARKIHLRDTYNPADPE